MLRLEGVRESRSAGACPQPWASGRPAYTATIVSTSPAAEAFI